MSTTVACPICTVDVRVLEGADPNIAMERHIAAGCVDEPPPVQEPRLDAGNLFDGFPPAIGAPVPASNKVDPVEPAQIFSPEIDRLVDVTRSGNRGDPDSLDDVAREKLLEGWGANSAQHQNTRSVSLLQTGEDVYAMALFPDPQGFVCVSNFRENGSGVVKAFRVDTSSDNVGLLSGTADWPDDRDSFEVLANGAQTPIPPYFWLAKTAREPRWIEPLGDPESGQYKGILLCGIHIEGLIEVWKFDPQTDLPGGDGGADCTKVSEKPLHALREHQSTVRGVASSADGTSFCSGSYDDMLRLYDSATMRELRVVNYHGRDINGVAMSADGNLMATASDDHSSSIWDVRAMDRPVRVFTGTSQLWNVDMDFDGNLLYQAADDGNAYAWDIGGNKLLARFNCASNLEGGRQCVRGVSAIDGSPGQFIASDGSGTARILDVGTLEVHQTVYNSNYRSCSNISFITPDRRFLVTGTSSNNITIAPAASSSPMVKAARS